MPFDLLVEVEEGPASPISEDPADSDRQSLLFAYPLGLEAGLYGLGSYIRPVVRLEFGCRGDVWPSDRQSIQPYVA